MADPVTIISSIASLAKIIKMVVDVGPDVIKTVEDAKPFAQQIFSTMRGGKEITADELKDLEAKIDELASELQRPLPPED